MRTFSAADYAVLVAVLVILTAIGLYYRYTGGRQSSTEEYLLGDRRQSVLPVALSLAASHMSGIAILGTPAEVYFRGAIFFVANLSLIIVIPITVHLFLPVFFKVGSSSTYEYLYLRFGGRVRTLASITYPVQSVMFMAVVLYAPSLALETLSGIPILWSIIIVGSVCTFYSTIGGIKAVIMTDVFQFMLSTLAVLSIIFSEYLDKGSFTNILKIASEGGRLNFSNFSLDPTERHTWWSLLIGGTFTYLGSYGIHQAQVQRYLTLKDYETARKTVYVSWLITSAFSFSLSFAGLCLYSRYHLCDPLAAGSIASQDQLVPFFVVDVLDMWPGMSGLVMAGVFSASLSSISATLNSLANISVHDFIKPLYSSYTHASLTDSQVLVLSKLLACVCGGLLIVMAYLAHFLAGILQVGLTLTGLVGGPMVATFTLGMFVPVANEAGALASLVSGLSLSLWLNFGGKRPPVVNLPSSIIGCSNSTLFTPPSSQTTLLRPEQYFYVRRLSYWWNVVLSSLLSFFMGLIVSLLTDYLQKNNTEQLKKNQQRRENLVMYGKNKKDDT
ncbi:putative sodium-dependent multivitamin transporter [Macrosteles quadrilineatus]|uniref:putative sodium-dependent multivitamin transporter n=1 Tax=Macrosteles quadrilineatus TaxID=74068 RepID=UPI0023E1B3BD|nr:putative sodium-dependent multivitamin transporter [Macrosteles quadrilineatus]